MDISGEMGINSPGIVWLDNMEKSSKYFIGFSNSINSLITAKGGGFDLISTEKLNKFSDVPHANISTPADEFRTQPVILCFFAKEKTNGRNPTP